MSIAPEPYLSACLTVLRDAILACRFAAWHCGWSPEQVADLMDAIHNIPEHIQKWDKWTVEFLRACLRGYDDKWGTMTGPVLCRVFDEIAGIDQP